MFVSVTLTDDMTMGFQMFVTANATGLPLTSYDMFRAFVVKKIETGLHDITRYKEQNVYITIWIT